jgi:hypothetical protein
MLRITSLSVFFALAYHAIVIASPQMQSPSKINTPPQIKRIVKGEIIQTQALDFDGDDKMDYLVLVKSRSAGPTDDRIGTELWVTSDLRVVKRKPKYASDYDNIWLINLDGDRVPEVISAYGYSDGIDYAVYKQNLRGKDDTLLFYFKPVLIDPDNRTRDYYWGYPWDVTNIVLRYRNGEAEISCSLTHRIESSDVEGGDNAGVPRWQQIIPAIFFDGKTTQPDISVGDIGQRQWLTLKALAERVRVGPKN